MSVLTLGRRLCVLAQHGHRLAVQGETDRLVQLAGFVPRYDCPSTTHPFASVFEELARSPEVRPYALHGRHSLDVVEPWEREERDRAAQRKAERQRKQKVA